MAPSKKVVGIAILSTTLGAALIYVLAALLRRKKKSTTVRPDVLNEAHPLDLALHGKLDHAAQNTMIRNVYYFSL